MTPPVRGISTWRSAAGRCPKVGALAVLALALAPSPELRAQKGAERLPGAAGTFAGTPAMLDSALAMELRALRGTRLDLEAAVRVALERSTAVGEARQRLAAAEAALLRERGEFDPEVFATVQRLGAESPTSSPFQGSKRDEFATDVGASVRLRTGTDLSATLGTSRQSSNSRFNTVDPQYTARGALEVRQPLLEGTGPAARAELAAARHDLEAARADHEGTLLAVRAQVERAYWDLHAAERDAAVERLVRDGAAALLESAERRARAGLVGPNQVANARTFLAQRETALLDSEERLDAASDRLATILGQRPEAGAARFRPTAEPPRDFGLAPQDSVVALAERSNHALRLLRHRVGALRARERGAARDALPTLDLTGGLEFAGLAGRGRPVVFGDSVIQNDLDTGVGDAWSQVFQGDFPTWSVGLRFAMALGRRSDTGERDRRRAETALGEQQLVGARRGLEETVRARCRDLEHAERRLALARDGVGASVEQVRIGRLEFESGRTTAFELVRLAGDLASAQQRYSQAIVRAAQAAAALRELTGGLYPPPR